MKYFELLFGIFIEFDFCFVVVFYDVDYYEVKLVDELEEVIDKVSYYKGLDIIEVKINCYENKVNY